ncbi:MAG: cobalamin B12-binding domain-containing protein [Sciscionella sp.]
MARRIKVLLTKPTQDCHDRGVRYLARKFRDAGFEVVFTNFLVASDILATAVQEDVDVIGVSSSSGGHMPVFEELLDGLSVSDADDVIVIGGGIIPDVDVRVLCARGVGAIFGPGSPAEDAIRFIRDHTRQRSTI